MEPFYRRHLPHWRQDQATYFVTWRLARGQRELDSSERELVATAVKSFRSQPYEIAAYVVMDDHVHALLAPLPAYKLRSILHLWKSFNTRQMQREHRRFGRVWQEVLRSDRARWQGICTEARLHHWKSMEALAGHRGIQVGVAIGGWLVWNCGQRSHSRAADASGPTL